MANTLSSIVKPATDPGYAGTPAATPAPAQGAPLNAFLAGAPKAAAPAAQPMAALPTIAPNTAYDQSYQNALAASRAGIASQVRNALAESQREQQVGQQQAGTLAPTVNGITAQAQSGLRSIASGADQVERDNGLQSFTPASQYAQPSLNAEGQLADFTKGAVPLIQSGIADRAAQRQAAIQQYQLEQNNALNMQQAQFGQAKSLAEMQMQHDQALQEWSRQNQLADMTQNHQWDVNAAATAAANQRSLYSTLYGPNSQVNPSTGVTYGQTAAMEKSPVYQRITRGLQSGAVSPIDVYRYYSAQNPQLLAVLADSNPSLAAIFASQAKAATGK